MRRSVDQYDTDGRLVAGYDYINQAWVLRGLYVDCSHPQPGEWLPATSSVYEGCDCYGRQHAGEQPPIGCRYTNPLATGDYLLQWWQCYSRGMLDDRQTKILVAWTGQELLHA